MTGAPATDLGFVHRFVRGEGKHGNVTLLLLHGTGGDENDLLGLGPALLPGAALLSPRGKVLENGMPRFFRRVAEGVFDEKDLIARTHELVAFVQRAEARYALDAAGVVAVGYSNGANIAASALLLHPGVFHAAVLFRAMVPFEPDATAAEIPATPVLLLAGQMDPIIPAANSERLAELLRAAGARVTVHSELTGHQLGPRDVAVAARWLEETLAG
jgi:predicted esterase